MRKLATRGLLLGLLLGLVVVTSGAIPRAGQAGIYRSLGTFSEVLSLVRNSYVVEPDESRLFSGAFAGITGALDPASDYIPPERLSAFRAHLSKPAAGVGLTLTRRMGYAAVSAVLPGSPAAEAGLGSGDVVEAIGGRSTRGLAVWEADVLLRGAVGSTVDLSVIRAGRAKKEMVRLERAKLDSPQPEVKKDGTVVLFHPVEIDEATAGHLDRALGGAGALILDLRGAGGDDVDSAAAVAARIVGAGQPFAEEVVRNGEPRKWATPAGEWKPFAGRIAVLVDGGTSGAAEVLAGLLGPTAATTVGEATSGLAGRRRLVALPSGGGLFLTVARYRPAGSAKAILPEGLDPEEEVFRRREPGEKPKDEVIERALEIVRGAELRKAA